MFPHAVATPRLAPLDRHPGGCGSRGALVDWVRRVCGWQVERSPNASAGASSQVRPKRWIGERIYCPGHQLNRQRRISKDDERLPETREALIDVAMIRLTVHQLARSREVSDASYVA
jgi:putative transposase